MSLLPITSIHHVNPLNFSQDTWNYTKEGRSKIHTNLRAIPKDVLVQVMITDSKNKSIEYNDNRISKYIAQYGNNASETGEVIKMNRVHCHHIIPLKLGGNDNYSNLVIVDWFIHKLIHMTNTKKITQILRSFNLNKKQKDKLNLLRSRSWQRTDSYIS